jgi:hypothetical protein
MAYQIKFPSQQGDLTRLAGRQFNAGRKYWFARARPRLPVRTARVTAPLRAHGKTQPMPGSDCSLLGVFDRVRVFNQPASIGASICP